MHEHTPNPNQPSWRKSSFSGANGDCVELALTDAGVLLRNSNNPDAATLTFTHAEIAAWIAACKAGELDDLR